MTLLDLSKATVVCGGASFLVYTFPVVGQITVIGLMSVMWLLYARQTLSSLRRH